MFSTATSENGYFIHASITLEWGRGCFNKGSRELP